MLGVDCTEIWKPVMGFEGVYSVSNYGRVRRDAGKRNWRAGRLLTPGASPKGYRSVSLCDGKSITYRRVARLVLEAFIGPPAAGQQVNHIDGNTANDTVSNLEWCTCSENHLHAIHILGRKIFRGVEISRSRLRDGDVREILGLRGKETQASLAKRFGVSPGCIQGIMDRRNWRHIG